MTGKSLLRQLTSIVLTLSLAVPLFTSCSKEEKEVVTPDLDVTPPVISVKMSEVDISGGKVLRIDGSQLLIGEDVVATWSDDKTESCTVTVHAAGMTVQSGALLQNAGTLTLNVVDKGGNSTDASVTLKVRSEYGQASIRVQMSEVNVFGGAEVKIEDNTLFICTDTVASWTPNDVPVKTVTLTFNGTAITSGSMLDQAGTLIMTVISEAGKSSQATINIKDEALYGVEKLKQAAMKVDNEIDLLEGITFADGVELVKVEVEIDGQRMTIPEPYHFSPEYPGVCNVIFTVKGKSGNTAEINVDNLTIKPLDYTTPSIESADPIKDYFSRYNNLTPKTKEFIYHHLLTSYLCMDRYKQNNLEYILMGEVPASFECENVGDPNFIPSGHADQGYANLKHLAPSSTIKVCSGDRQYLEDYINQHPDKVCMVSCAYDFLGGNTLEDLKNNPTYNTLKRILGKENIIISVAVGNQTPPRIKMMEENTPLQEGGRYTSASVTSDKNNKITIAGYNPNQRNIFLDDNQSNLPVGFGKGNIVVPFIPLTSRGSNQELTNHTFSSYPTAAENGSLGNFLSIIMHTHPGTTLEDAMTIMLDNYLREETFKYKNDDGNIVDGDKWYFFDTDKFLNNEILHKSDIDAIQLTGDEVVLPSVPGIIYEGEGIQFEYGGQKYDVSDTAHLTSALTSDVSIRWFWNKTRFRKYGGTRSATIKAQYVDTRGKAVPDVSLLTVKRNVQ